MTFWYRSPAPVQPPVGMPGPAVAVHHLRAWTENLCVTGSVRARTRQDRLLDILNRQEPINVRAAHVIPLGATSEAEFTQSEMVLDPYDCDFVLGGPLDPQDADNRRARRIHKVRYPVLVIGTTFEVRGTIHLFPGNSPEFATQHSGSLFVPVTNQIVRRHRRIVSGPDSDVAFVNRHAIVQIRQLDTLN